MSYAALHPEYYEMLTPQSAWHAGSPGWSTAPYVGWGENAFRAGPRRLAVGAYYGTQPLEPVKGLGCGCAARGVGDDSTGKFLGLPTWYWVTFAVVGVGVQVASYLEKKHHKSWYK